MEVAGAMEVGGSSPVNMAKRWGKPWKTLSFPKENDLLDIILIDSGL
jgi:hypothetical protein